MTRVNLLNGNATQLTGYSNPTPQSTPSNPTTAANRRLAISLLHDDGHLFPPLVIYSTATERSNPQQSANSPSSLLQASQAINLNSNASITNKPNDLTENELKKIIENLKKEDFSYLKTNPTWDENLDFVEKILKASPVCYKYIQKNNKKNSAFIEEIVKFHPDILGVIKKELHKNRRITAQAILANADAFQYAHPNFKADPALLEIAIKKNGLLLQYTNEELKQNRQIVKKSIQNNGMALQFAGENLKKDISIVKLAIQNNPAALQFADSKLQKNDQLIQFAEKIKTKQSLQTNKNQAELNEGNTDEKPRTFKRLKRHH